MYKLDEYWFRLSSVGKQSEVILHRVRLKTNVRLGAESDSILLFDLSPNEFPFNFLIKFASLHVLFYKKLVCKKLSTKMAKILRNSSTMSAKH